MNKKSMGIFWFGFVVSALSFAWLYWLWRRQREVTPGPLVITERPEKQKSIKVREGEKKSRVDPSEALEPPADPGVFTRRRSEQDVDEDRESAESPAATNDLVLPKKDRLERIKGIGPVTASRFNEAGVFTFSQLASLSAEQVAEIVDPGRWDPGDWISEASRLASK